eukprot:172975_1
MKTILTGKKIVNMRRKPFIAVFVKYFNDKKLSLELGKLYNGIIKYDIKQLISDKEEQVLLSPLLIDDVISNAPKMIIECNSDQIVAILSGDDIFDNVQKLNTYKLQIIDYVKENKYDGNKLITLKRKHFTSIIANHLNDKKLRALIGRLYN